MPAGMLPGRENHLSLQSERWGWNDNLGCQPGYCSAKRRNTVVLVDGNMEFGDVMVFPKPEGEEQHRRSGAKSR